MLLSEFVEQELAEAAIHLAEAEVVKLNTEEAWEFFHTLRTSRPGLGNGELGALTVARFRKATLLTNDQQAGQTAQELGIAVSGTVAVLEYRVETERLGGAEAVHILEEMIRQGAWISNELFEGFKQKVLKGE